MSACSCVSARIHTTSKATCRLNSLYLGHSWVQVGGEWCRRSAHRRVNSSLEPDKPLGLNYVRSLFRHPSIISPLRINNRQHFSKHTDTLPLTQIAHPALIEFIVAPTIANILHRCIFVCSVTHTESKAPFKMLSTHHFSKSSKAFWRL